MGGNLLIGVLMVIYPSVIIDDFHIFRAFFRPPENKTPLVIDADAALTFSITQQFLKSVGGPCSQVRKRRGGIKILQAILHLFFNDAIASNAFALEQGTGVLVPEAPYHAGILADGMWDVKRPRGACTT